MDNIDKGENSIKFAMLYRDTEITADELNKHSDVITKECRKYLIGKICERGKNNCNNQEEIVEVYTQFGQEFNYTWSTIKNIVAYARAIDQLYITAPDVASSILAGSSGISYKNVMVLSKMELNDICAIIERLACEKISATTLFKEQKEQIQIKKRGRPKQKSRSLPRKSVKDTPPDDPDAQIMALVYTIPSWISAIENNFTNTNFDRISLAAYRRFIKELDGLKETAATMISILRDEK